MCVCVFVSARFDSHTRTEQARLHSLHIATFTTGTKVASSASAIHKHHKHTNKSTKAKSQRGNHSCYPPSFRSQLTVNYCGHPPLFLTPPSFVARQLFQKVSTIRINMQAVALNSQIPNLHAKYPRRIYTHLLSTCNPASFSHASLMHHTMQKGMHCRKNRRSSRSITCSKIPVRDATHIQRRTQPSTRHCAVL